MRLVKRPRIRQPREVFADGENSRRRARKGLKVQQACEVLGYSQMPKLVVKGLAEAQGFLVKLNQDNTFD